MPQSRKSNRRRRLLVDASTPLGDAPAAPEVRVQPKKSTGVDPRLYTLAAERRHQRKTTDLIPKRRFAYSYMVLLLAAAIVLLNLLASYSTTWEAAIGQRGVQTLAIWGAGTLASWFATVCWMIAAVCCMQIFVLRRHRNDDYEGTYRVWGWLTAVCLFASMACTVDLKGIVFNLATFLSAMTFEDPAWLPIAMIGVLSCVVFVRYLLEVRQSYGTVVWGTLAWLLFNVGMFADAQGPEIASNGWFGWLATDLLFGNAMLFVAVSVLMANTTYARFVFFRANGLVKAKPIETAAEEESAEPAAATSTTRKRKARTKRNEESQADAETPTSTSRSKATSKKPKSTKAKTTKRKSANAASGEEAGDVVEKTATVEKPKPAGGKRRSASAKEPAKTEAATSDASPESARSAGSSKAEASKPSASDKLRQLAAASRAKQAAAQEQETAQSSASVDASLEDEPPATVKMTKAERRRQRKQKRQKKRAA